DGEGDELDPALVLLNEETIKRATVFIMQTTQDQGQTVISCVGSGTLVSAGGLILTNAHIVLESDACRSDTLVVSVTVRLDEPPIPTYTAEIVSFSRGLDLAAIRINGYLDGRAIEPGDLNLPFVELGDSLAAQLDDTISVIGYPSFGNAPVEARRGTLSGFTAEARAGDRAWLRTGTTIPGTMSGAGAYNRAGQLIGVPTIAPARVAGGTVDCRVIQDTNRDGRADDNDHCVPVGGFITALRPSRLARGLVRAAALGIRQGESRVSAELPLPEADPVFSRPFFTTRINESGVPVNVMGSVPAGTTSLYLFFDYDYMVDGLVYELRVSIDNIPDPVFSLPSTTWSGGRRGLWYIGSANTTWPNGVYDFRLFIEGREVTSAQITIGGPPPDDPGFSDIVFGLLDDQSNLVGTNYVLPEGGGIQARFSYYNMQPETQWSYVWYFNGNEMYRQTETWDAATYGEQGTRLITAAADFLPGQYRLALYVNGVLSATADFVIAGGAEINRAVIFSNFRVTDAQTGGVPTGALRNEFPAGTGQVYAFFDWRLLAPGTMWTRRWLVDGEPVFEVTEPWNAPGEGENYYVSLDSLDGLPDATYTLEIELANVRQASTEARVGLGQLPVEAFASAEGVQMAGQVIDAETGDGIPGAMFIVLEPEFSVEDFLWDRSQVLGLSLADSEGRFQVETLLPRGTEDDPVLYSVLVRAEGYLPVSADGIGVGPATDSPVTINVALTRN
ncbi:MAG: trypsin-like peptidase domain-containing protein, partial [Anaerolineae bacterium]|nr:trypsin-like peptidase domain-containing protein [Anaerolineae bacterium]